MKTRRNIDEDSEYFKANTDEEVLKKFKLFEGVKNKTRFMFTRFIKSTETFMLSQVNHWEHSETVTSMRSPP